MAKGFTFGKSKQRPEKEPKPDDSGVDVTDIVDTYVDKNLETIALLQQEKEKLETRIEELEDELLTKNTNIQGYNETIEAFSTKIIELTERNDELETQAQVQEKITVKTPKGFKPAITEKTIAQMREYAYSLLPKKGTIKFYEEVGKKFGVASGSAYKYCRDIYQGIDSTE